MTLPSPSGPDVDALPEEIERAIARVATAGTIVCHCCNASDVTDDDHRAGCPVWDLRRSLAALARSAADMEEALRKIADAEIDDRLDDLIHGSSLRKIARATLAAVRSREQQEGT